MRFSAKSGPSRSEDLRNPSVTFVHKGKGGGEHSGRKEKTHRKCCLSEILELSTVCQIDLIFEKAKKIVIKRKQNIRAAIWRVQLRKMESESSENPVNVTLIADWSSVWIRFDFRRKFNRILTRNWMKSSDKMSLNFTTHKNRKIRCEMSGKLDWISDGKTQIWIKFHSTWLRNWAENRP